MSKLIVLLFSVLWISCAFAAPAATAPASGGFSDDSGSLHMAPPSTGKNVPASSKAAAPTGVVDTGDSLKYIVDPATQKKAAPVKAPKKKCYQ